MLIRKESKLNFLNHLLPYCRCIYYETLQDKELLLILEDAMHSDLFIHCAWEGVSNIERDQKSQITYNITLTTDAVILANNLKCKKWVGMGSQAEYGIVNDIAKEETTPISPFSAYGKSKVACYRTASGLCQIFGLPMLSEVVNYIKKQINLHIYVGYGQKPYAENQIMHIAADISKLKKVTKWKLVFDLQTGLSETIDYYLKN